MPFLFLRRKGSTQEGFLDVGLSKKDLIGKQVGAIDSLLSSAVEIACEHMSCDWSCRCALVIDCWETVLHMFHCFTHGWLGRNQSSRQLADSSMPASSWHYDIWKYFQNNSKARAKVLQNRKVPGKGQAVVICATARQS